MPTDADKPPPPPDAPRDQLTCLLAAAGRGEPDAASKLLPIIYEELRRMAQHQMAGQRPGQTLQATALVNEAYMKLFSAPVEWERRGHFFGAAARAMRQILVDAARSRGRIKRGGERQRVPLDQTGIHIAAADPTTDVLQLDDALTALEERDPRAAEIVHLRYFVGLTIEQVAECMNIGERTVRRDWTFARAFLARELNEGGDGDNESH